MPGPAPELLPRKISDVTFTHEADELVSGMSKYLKLSGSPSKTKDSTEFFGSGWKAWGGRPHGQGHTGEPMHLTCLPKECPACIMRTTINSVSRGNMCVYTSGTVVLLCVPDDHDNASAQGSNLLARVVLDHLVKEMAQKLNGEVTWTSKIDLYN